VYVIADGVDRMSWIAVVWVRRKKLEQLNKHDEEIGRRGQKPQEQIEDNRQPKLNIVVEIS